MNSYDKNIKAFCVRLEIPLTKCSSPNLLASPQRSFFIFADCSHRKYSVFISVCVCSYINNIILYKSFFSLFSSSNSRGDLAMSLSIDLLCSF